MWCWNNPVSTDFYNGTSGNLFPICLNRIIVNGKTVYNNKYSRLSEEEISMAKCFEDMISFLDFGKEFYPLEFSSSDVKTEKMIN